MTRGHEVRGEGSAAPRGRRIAAVVLPRVRLELVAVEGGGKESGEKSGEKSGEELAAGEGRERRERRAPLEGGPLALVVARPGGAVKDERSLLGNTRLDEVSPEAYALGVRPGHTIAAARARAADLRVRVVHEGAVTATLSRLAEALFAFGATTSLSTLEDVGEDSIKDTVWIDLTGCAHLFGGEEHLAAELSARVRSLGHACRVGVADGPRIAAQIAWFSRQMVTIAPPGAGAEAMRGLPVSALPIDGETLRWLRASGMRTVGDVQALAREPRTRRGLGVRLASSGAAGAVMALLDGDDRAPLVPYVPPSRPEERVELEYGVTSVDALLFVVKRLSSQLGARLEGRAMGATRLELVLSLDRALLSSAHGRSARARGHEDVLTVAVPTPLARAAELFAVLRARLESSSRVVARAPVLAATLRAAELAPRPSAALDLFVPEARADRALPGLVAELVAELGAERVGTLRLVSRWSPEHRAVLLPFGARPPAPPRLAPRTSHALEPTRLLPRAKPLASRPAVTVTTRFEAVEWWRAGSTRRDYGQAWIEGAEAMAWVEMSEASAGIKGWVD